MTDSELVQALQQGNREVFGDLVDRYRDMVQGLCQRIAGNPRDAEELAHDTFVEAYLKIGTLREPERLRGWLRTIALNLCRMWYRRRRQAWGELPEEVAAAEPDDEDPALLARMSAGLAELPAAQRLVLVLHYLERMSYEQVAEFLDMPIGTVMSRLHRARRALREILETPCPDEDVPMSEEDRFKQEVQAEIAVLLGMFGRDRGAAERLTVILQHSPERFGQLTAQADDEQMVALTAAEALGRCVDLRWLQEATADEFAHAVRVRAKWPPLRSEDLEPTLVTRMLEHTGGLLDSPHGEIRNTAMGALGRWRAGSYLKRIMSHAVHEEQSTQLAAIRALAEIGDVSAAGVLMHIARGPDNVGVRRAAIETLGRMKVPDAEDLLVGLLEDPDQQVQEAAVIAPGELDSPAAQAALQNLLTSGGKRLKKAAARVVFSRQRNAAKSPGSPPHQTQSQRLRGDARSIVYSSINAVLRRALPETGPYEEQDLTRRIAAVCIDYSMTRRRLVDEGWMTREAGVYELTESGQAGWRVEEFIVTHYLR